MRQIFERMVEAKDRISEGVAFTGFAAAIIAFFLPDTFSNSIKYAMLTILFSVYIIFFAFNRMKHVVIPEKSEFL